MGAPRSGTSVTAGAPRTGASSTAGASSADAAADAAASRCGDAARRARLRTVRSRPWHAGAASHARTRQRHASARIPSCGRGGAADDVGRRQDTLKSGKSGLSYFPCEIWRFDRQSPGGSTTCKIAEGEKVPEPPSLTASGSSRDYRQILHDPDDYATRRKLCLKDGGL